MSVIAGHVKVADMGMCKEGVLGDKGTNTFWYVSCLQPHACATLPVGYMHAPMQLSYLPLSQRHP